ncbi:MAG TPA: methyltransferase domain-containing protein [Candidatus Binataceae bacterium]|nr:methyltransferase domain-containing protein [Candidatus Binataceae bacterium]
MTRLNLGCGLKRIQGAVNVDVAKSVGPDIVCDLNRRPWPFASDQFSEVFAYDVIEHCDDAVLTMEEIHRVCAHGAVVHITVPHFSCANAFTDPTHRRQFGWGSFHYFTREHALSFYSSAAFRRRTSQIIFFPTFVNKVIRRIANRYPEEYERRWAWLFPAWFLYFELEVIKRHD